MDYLERLDQSLSTLEKEANQLANLPDLIREMGRTADSISAEKKELSALSEKLTVWSDAVEKDFQDMTQALQTNHENLQKVNITMLDNQSKTEESLQRISRTIQDNQDTIETRFKQTEQTLQENQKEAIEELAAFKKDVEGYIDEIRSQNKTLRTLSIISIVISVICCGALVYLIMQ